MRWYVWMLGDGGHHRLSSFLAALVFYKRHHGDAKLLRVVESPEAAQCRVLQRRRADCF